MTNLNLDTSRRKTPVLPSAKLVQRKDITEDLMVIKLEPEEGQFQFKPGQYCTLGKDGIERAYSIVSAPYEPLLEMHDPRGFLISVDSVTTRIQ